MKTVFANQQCAHVWAQQKQEEGRSGNGNLYFRGATIYSYRDSWPLATFTNREHDDKRVVLVNSDSFSISTNGHRSDVRRALNGLDVLTIDVTRESLNSYLDAQRPRYQESELETAARVESCALAIVQEKIDATAKTAAAMAKPRKSSYYGDSYSTQNKHLSATYDELAAGAWREAANARATALDDSAIIETAATLGVTAPAYDLPTLRRSIGAAFEAFYSPEALAKREKAARRRKKTAPVDSFNKTMARCEKDSYVSYRERNKLDATLRGIAAARPDYLETALARVHAWRLREESDELFETLNPDASALVRQRKYGESKTVTAADWLAGAQGRFYSDSPTLLRRVGDRLQTSRGAEAPFNQAVAIFAKAQQCRAAGKPFAPNGERYRAGSFELDSIDETGAIRIGCHLIEFAEMQRLAIQQVPDLVAPRFPVPAII